MKKYRVISTQKQTATVINVDKNITQACFFARKQKPICGDFVEIQKNKNEFVISSIYSQDNFFSRANHKGHRQNIAANVDNQIIVVAVEPEPTRDLINRYLIAAHSCKMNPIIVFNKFDINPDYFDVTKKLYQSLGYTTLTTSTKNNSNFKELVQLMHGKTSIFVGMSGVGKSSISEIILNTQIKTGDISKKTGKGSHVTSVTQLYKIPDTNNQNTQAYLIDSPGVWEYGLWKMDAGEIAAGFPEISKYSQNCRFSNCTHTHEPKCTVKNAFDEKHISKARYNSYLRIIDSMKYWE